VKKLLAERHCSGQQEGVRHETTVTVEGLLLVTEDRLVDAGRSCRRTQGRSTTPSEPLRYDRPTRVTRSLTTALARGRGYGNHDGFGARGTLAVDQLADTPKISTSRTSSKTRDVHLTGPRSRRGRRLLDRLIRAISATASARDDRYDSERHAPRPCHVHSPSVTQPALASSVGFAPPGHPGFALVEER
jgi:hypothetical protein